MTAKKKGNLFFDEKEAMLQAERREYYDRRLVEMVRLGYGASNG